MLISNEYSSHIFQFGSFLSKRCCRCTFGADQWRWTKFLITSASAAHQKFVLEQTHQMTVIRQFSFFCSSFLIELSFALRYSRIILVKELSPRNYHIITYYLHTNHLCIRTMIFFFQNCLYFIIIIMIYDFITPLE